VMISVFAEFEHAMIQERVRAGMARGQGQGHKERQADWSAGHPSRGVRPSAPPMRLAGSACEPLPHSSVLVSRLFG
jgi:hypothetical protein